MRNGINQWQSTHNHICVDSDFTLALAFALCALRAFSNAFERNSAPVGKAAQLPPVLLSSQNASAPFHTF